MSIDFVGDFLTIIRNATMVSKPSITTRYSGMRYAIATILKNEGFVKDVLVEDVDDVKKNIKVVLKYARGESVIHEIKRVSTPGCRVYKSIGEVKPVIGGMGLTILSTPAGVVSHKDARKNNVGGEILCTIW